MPPDDPAAKAWAEPGEVMYPGLGAIDWQHLDSVNLPNRHERLRGATRTLILTDRRIIVLDEARMGKTDLLLSDVEDVFVGLLPAKSAGREIEEAMVQVVFRAGAELRAVRWKTRARDADVFTQMLREFVSAIGRGTWAANSDRSPPPRLGHILPMFEADEAKTGWAAPLEQSIPPPRHRIE